MSECFASGCESGGDRWRPTVAQGFQMFDLPRTASCCCGHSRRSPDSKIISITLVLKFADELRVAALSRAKRVASDPFS